MAITKRTRFEVFRRDDFTCQYCGAKPPEAELRPDHVLPRALGGDDKPSNLVTACHDCNAGKSSIAPDSPLVEGISAKAAAYAAGMVDKMTKVRASFEALEDYDYLFLEAWNQWEDGAGRSVPLPPDYKASLYRWQESGIPADVFDLAIPIAMKKTGLRGEFGTFTYMAGVVHNMVKLDEIDMGLTVETAATYTESEREEYGQYNYMVGRDAGWKQGVKDAKAFADGIDFLRQHIDRGAISLAMVSS